MTGVVINMQNSTTVEPDILSGFYTSRLLDDINLADFSFLFFI